MQSDSPNCTGFELDESALAEFRASLELGLAAAFAGEDTSLTVEARASMSAACAASFLDSSQLDGVIPAGPDAVTLTIAQPLTGSELWAWTQLPRERSAAYFPWVSSVSVRMQQALRRWLPAFLLADSERLEDLKQGPCYLLYRASAPHRPRTRASFANDVLDAAHIRSLYRSAQAGLKPLLPPIESQLREAGLTEVARMYTARRIGRCLEPVRGQIPRALEILLAAEAALIEDVIRIATEISAAGSLAQRRSLAREIPKAIQTSLRRAAKGQILEWLTPLVFAEASQALAAAAGVGGDHIKVHVSVRFLPLSPMSCKRLVLEQSCQLAKDPGKADHGDDRGGVRPEGERRHEGGAGVQPVGRPGERVSVESDPGAPRHAGTVVPFPGPVLRSEFAGVEDGDQQSGPRLPDYLAA